MIFIAQLTHTPELCFGRPEHKEMAKVLMEFFENMGKYEKEAGVKKLGFYQNEHTFTFILESDNYLNVSNFLSIDPLLTHHTVKITPVSTLEETLEFARKVVKK